MARIDGDFFSCIWCVSWLNSGRSGKAGRRCEWVRELAGDFVVYERFFAEPADGANDEERGQVAVSIERHGRALRHGSSWSFGLTK